MKSEIKEKWLEALRSGQYKQAREVLVADGAAGQGYSYCCLGVLCDLAIKDGIEGLQFDASRGVFEELNVERGVWMEYDEGELPESVQAWAELFSGDPRTSAGSLIRLNDDEQWDFEQIADIIEREL